MNDNKILTTHDTFLRLSKAEFENTCTGVNQSQPSDPSSLALLIRLVEILLVVDIT